MFADIILPSNTKFETEDIGTDCDSGQWNVVFYERQAINPIGESKSDKEVVGEVAKALEKFGGIYEGIFDKYIGGKTDMILMRIVDILYAIPNLLLVILIMLVFGSNVTSIMIGICLTSWIGMARMVRAQVMSLKEQEFALAAYVLGASKSRILFKHLVINCMGSIIVNVTLLVPSAIFTEAFLSFVGIGCQLGYPGK